MQTAMARPSRRTFVTSALALAAAGGSLRAWAAPAMPVGAPFSFDLLTEWMRARAAEPQAQPARPEGFLGALTQADHQDIRFRPERARWSGPDDAFRLQAFHPGWLYGTPVEMFDVSAGTVQPLAFSTADFAYLGALAGRVPADTPLPGVAGFRLLYPLNRPDIHEEALAFLGASYFRALGRGSVYGLSARGLALNTGTGAAEEFPRFAAFYLERPAPGVDAVVLSAALDSASVTGAFRFVIRPGAATAIEVTARLFFRADVAQVGIAPMSSMFLYDETGRGAFDDWRPRVHSSNGLRIVRADGDVTWRALKNPAALADSWFADRGGRFGLHQRGRDFDDYQDAAARFDRRPSLEVEPLGDWGPGAVRLVELPSDLEVNDNIVAFWVAEGAGARAGEAREYRYVQHWGDLAADGADRLALVSATRAGAAPDAPGARRFVVDFAGAALAALPADAAIELVIAQSAGEVIGRKLEPVPDEGVWRAVLDVAAPGAAVVELSAHLAGYGRKLTETWLYQWNPA